MLKQQATIFRRIAYTLDLVIVIGSFLAAYYLRDAVGPLGHLNDYVWLLLFAIPIWITLLTSNNLYASLRFRSQVDIIIDIFKVHFVGGVMLSAVIFVFDPHHFSRILFISFLLISYLLMTACKLSIKYILADFRRRGLNTRHILIVGTGQNAANLCELINDHDEWGIQLTSLTIDMQYSSDTCAGVSASASRAVHSIEQIVEYSKNNAIDEVIFALDKNDTYNIEEFIAELQTLGLTVRVVIDFLSIPGANKETSLFFGEIPMLTYSNFSLNSNQILAKRCLDIFGALVGLLINAMMLPFIAVAIKLDSHGPIFFGQSRVRENGRRFVCWKYRTMFVDAEAQKQALMEQNEMQGAMFKMQNDPRVTRVGNFLRRSSLDEFPQFWNVLCGQMSLVGTRPPTPDEVETYENWHRKRISIKPGITGLWQISGRNRIQNFDDVVRLDIRYIEEWSIWLDIKIILKTPWVMMMRRGAS